MGRLMEESVYAEYNGEPLPMIVDLGYIKDKATQDRCDAVIAHGISRKNFSIEVFNRMFVKIPPRKAARFMAAFPVVEGATYFRATHHWL